MGYRVLLSALLLLPAGVRAQSNEHVVEDPADCPKNTVGVREPRTGGYVCKPKLQTRRDIFAGGKHPQDPCPDGWWWHRSRDACKPVVCTQEPNPNDLKNLCLAGHHEHLTSGDDWTHPITCVVDYEKSNEARGGRNPVHGGCELCVIAEHRGAGQRPWAFQKPGPRARTGGAPAPAQGRRGGFSGGFGNTQFRRPASAEPKKPRGCDEGTYTSTRDAGKCLPCAEGAATVRRADGRTYCVGGTASAACPAGAGLMATNSPFQPVTCVPCIKGEESLALNGFSQCLRNPCPDGELPVPEEGVVDRYSCAPPMEGADGVDWTRVLAVGNKTPASAPPCGRGEGIALEGKSFKCRPCAEGLSVLQLNGFSVCGKRAPACTEGAVPGEGGRCVKCPEGSKVAIEGGSRSPRCVPDEAPAAPPVEAAAPAQTAPTKSEPQAEPDRGPQTPPPAQPEPLARPPQPDELPPAAEPEPETRSRIFPPKNETRKAEPVKPPPEQPITMPKAKPEAWEDSGQAAPAKREPKRDENGQLTVPALR